MCASYTRVQLWYSNVVARPLHGRSVGVLASTAFAKGVTMKLVGTHAFLALSISLISSGCDVLGLRRDDPMGELADARTATADGAEPEPSPSIVCKNPVASFGGGEHNPGRACNACHTGSGEAPKFTVAGTLYNSAGVAISGATISVVDAASKTYDIVTQRNGNFYTSRAMTFPIRVVASKCPDGKKMYASVSNGDCNSSGCHAATGGAGRIHLP